MPDELDAKWEEREQRLADERRRANRIGLIALVVVLVVSIGGCVWWRVASNNAAEEERRDAAAEAASAPATASATPGLDEEFPAGTFGIGEEVRVKKGKDVINQRREPRTDAAVVTTLGWPQNVRILERTIPKGDRYVWYLVVSWDGTNEGPQGWVRGDLLEKQ